MSDQAHGQPAGFLKEHAQGVLRAIDIAMREWHHLDYTTQTLFATVPDLDWVESLSTRQDRSEKVDAFVSRFGRLQDHLGDKLIPQFAALLGERPYSSMLDLLVLAERRGWVADAEAFIATRKLRNKLVHEYAYEPHEFLESLLAAREAANMLGGTVKQLQRTLHAIGLTQDRTNP